MTTAIVLVLRIKWLVLKKAYSVKLFLKNLYKIFVSNKKVNTYP